MAKTKVTILNSMAGRDFEQALDAHVSWSIKLVDLKDSILGSPSTRKSDFGKNIVGLTEEEAERTADLIHERDLSVYCLSTGLFHGDIELGEERFRGDYLGKLDHVISLAKILKPKMIRLLAARTSRRGEIEDSVEYIRANHPWLIPLYAEAIDGIYNSGFRVAIENEVGNCIFSNPEEILGFFEELDRPEKACLTWDVQNLWQMGTYPTMDVYDKLKGLIGYYHLKGGQEADGSTELRWRSALEDASWPVVEITRQVVIDGATEVICLNSSHGKAKEGYDYSNIVKRDLDFIRSAIPEVE